MVAGFIPFDAGRSAPRELPERVFTELPQPNINPIERSLTLVAGAAVAFEAIRRRERLGSWLAFATAMAGGAMALRAIGGYCPIEGYFQNRKEGDERILGPHEGRVRQFLPRILRSISIRASREEVVQRLRDLPNLDGIRFEVLGEPIADEIFWKFENVRGVFRLIEGPPKKGLEIQASVDEIPQETTSDEVEATLRRVLRSLKQFIEAGEIATTEGQTHGRRKFSLKGRISWRLRHVGSLLERN